MMGNKTANTYYICYAWCEHEERMVDFFGSPNKKDCEEECQYLMTGTRHKIVRVDDRRDCMQGLRLGRLIAESKGKKPKPTNGANVLAWQQFTMHEGDKHLFYVLAEFNGEYVVWSFNKQDGGCYYGKYFNTYTVMGLRNAVDKFEELAEPHREYALLSKQEKFERSMPSSEQIVEVFS